jgi:membrane protease YdiL (CAAX protease family)
MPNNGPDSTGCVYDSGVTPGIRFPSILLLFFGGVFAAFLAYVLAYSLGVPRFASELISALANDGYWIAGYQWLSRERDWSSLRARFAPVPGNVLWKAVGAALALVAFFLSLAAILQGLGVELKAISTIDLLQGGRKALPFVLILIVILAPAAEELLCRGLLLDWLRRHLSATLAIAISALVFSLLHGISIRSGTSGWLQFGYRVALGAVLGIFAVRYRSLLPSFALHAANNFAALIAASQFV